MPFQVPEFSRLRSGPQGTDASYGNNGVFMLPSCEPGWDLFLICSDCTEPEPGTVGLPPWEHVSVSARRLRQTRIPTWKEMCFVKRLCWDAEDVVMQLHPKESEYVNQHPHVLHLWRPVNIEIPQPPSIFVGFKEAE